MGVLARPQARQSVLVEWPATDHPNLAYTPLLGGFHSID